MQIEQWQVLCRTAEDGDWLVWDTYDENLEAFAVAEGLKRQGNQVMVERMLCSVVLN